MSVLLVFDPDREQRDLEHRPASPGEHQVTGAIEILDFELLKYIPRSPMVEYKCMFARIERKKTQIDSDTTQTLRSLISSGAVIRTSITI